MSSINEKLNKKLVLKATNTKADWEVHSEHYNSARWSEPCPCGGCQKVRAEAEKKTRMETGLADARTAKETVAAFESEFGPVEQYACGDKEFSYAKGKVRLRSQKARGLAVGREQYSWSMCYPKPHFISAEKILAMLPQHGKELDVPFPIFARPCPTRPRHGFVESRVVNSEKELLGLLCETLEADPSGEVMLMRPLTGAASAVATDTGVVWGKGNAGVTAGTGDQWLIPVPASEKTLTARLTEESSILAKDLRGSVFIECVEHQGKVRIVQMRDGPASVPVGGDYVPEKDYKVENIIHLDAKEQLDVNLLEWEKRVLSAPKGTVVMLPGSSLTSHLAVHALAKKFAVLTDKDKDVDVGAILQPASDQPAPLTKADYAKMASLIKRKLPHGKNSRAAFSVAVLHAQAAWGNAPHLLWARVAGAAMMARLLVSACVGEARHFYTSGPGRYSSKVAPSVPWKKILGKALPSERKYDDARVPRSKVLEKVYRYSLSSLRSLAEASRRDFKGYWGDPDDEDGGTGYGGPKWAESARVAMKLCDALLAFERKPTAARWTTVLMAYNNGVAAAHNGGRLLDKWAEWSEIDLCAKHPQWGLLSPQMMFITTGVKMAQTGMVEDDPFGLYVREKGKVAKTVPAVPPEGEVWKWQHKHVPECYSFATNKPGPEWVKYKAPKTKKVKDPVMDAIKKAGFKSGKNIAKKGKAWKSQKTYEEILAGSWQ